MDTEFWCWKEIHKETGDKLSWILVKWIVRMGSGCNYCNSRSCSTFGFVTVSDLVNW
jgi:hypothetical protein